MPDEIQSIVTSGERLEVLQVVTVPLEQVAELEQQRWEVWDHPESPLDPVTRRDIRKVDRTEDVMTTDGPSADSDRFLKGDIEMFNRPTTSTNQHPGQLLSPDGCLPEAKASTLTFSSFVPHGKMTDRHSATTRCHSPKYLRPPNIGNGWGDYDQFIPWQAWGRQLKPEMVEEKDWIKDLTKPMVFVAEDGTKEVIDMMLSREDMDLLENLSENPVGETQCNPPP